jgi:hypothetical protein
MVRSSSLTEGPGEESPVKTARKIIKQRKMIQEELVAVPDGTSGNVGFIADDTSVTKVISEAATLSVVVEFKKGG